MFKSKNLCILILFAGILISVSISFNCTDQYNDSDTTIISKITNHDINLIKEKFSSKEYYELCELTEDFYKIKKNIKYSVPLYLKASSIYEKTSYLNSLLKKNNKSAKSEAKKWKKFGINYINNRFIYSGNDFIEYIKKYSDSPSEKDARFKLITLYSGNSFINKKEIKENSEKLIKNIPDYIDKYPDDENIESMFLTLIKAYQAIAGNYNLFSTKYFNHTKFNQKYIDDAINIIDKYSPQFKSEFIPGLTFIKAFLFHFYKDTIDNALSIYKEIIFKYPKSHAASLSYYYMGEIEYINNNIDSALSNYKNAYTRIQKRPINKLSDYSIYSYPNISAFISKISKKIEFIETQIKYGEEIKNAQIAVVYGLNVRIRKKPVISKKTIITTVNTGEKVIVNLNSRKSDTIDSMNNYWYKVRLRNGIEGWIFGEYIILFNEI